MGTGSPPRSRSLCRGAAALLAAAPLAGCASLPFGLGAGASVARDERVVRPEAPPEYDVLVAQQFEVQGRMNDALEAYERAVAKDPSSVYLHRKLSESLARASRLEDSLVHARRAFELEPEDVSTRHFLGQIYQLRRDVAGAEEVLLDESGAPIDETAAFRIYQIYLGSDRDEDALEVARWWADRDPDSVQARVALANAFARLSRPLEAEAALRAALERDPDNLRIYVELARSARDRGDRAAEIAVYEEVLADDPDNHAMLVALSEAQMAQEDLEGALATLERIERLHPDDLRSIARLGYLYYEARRYDEAAERFERVLAENPEEHQLAFFLGVVRRRAGDSEGALAAFGRVPPDHEDYAGARTQMAAIHERRGDYGPALSEVRRAVEARPSRELQLYEATLRAKSGDLAGAVEELERLLAESPDDDELLYNLGVVYGESERTEEALRYMDLALEQNPENASALNYIGYTWAEQGVNLDQAQELIERAIGLRPEDGYIVDSLGWVYYMRARPLVESGRMGEARGYLERALEELERADELTGGDPVVSEHLGDAYLLLDQKRRALEKFEEAVRLEPREDEQPQLYEKLENLRRELR